MGAVYHARYLEFFETGRTEMLRVNGLPYREIERMGLFIPVLEVHAAFRKPALYDDVIHVVTALKEIPQVRFRIDYEICRDGDLLADGYTLHSFINAQTRRPMRAPEEFLAVVGKGFV
jgi:acyl-CoA thioester hydrolase